MLDEAAKDGDLLDLDEFDFKQKLLVQPVDLGGGQSRPWACFMSSDPLKFPDKSRYSSLLRG